jgi:hypothetical protein
MHEEVQVKVGWVKGGALRSRRRERTRVGSRARVELVLREGFEAEPA